MQLKATKCLSERSSQIIFGEMEAEIDVTIENAELLAQTTKTTYFKSGDKSLSLWNLLEGDDKSEIESFFENKIFAMVTAQKQKQVTLDLANSEIIDFLQKTVEARKQYVSEKEAERQRKEELQKLFDNKHAELEQIEGITISQWGDIMFRGEDLDSKPAQSDFIKMTPATLYAKILAHLYEKVENKTKRVAQLEGHLESLIKASNADALIKAGLAEPPAPEHDEEEGEGLTDEQQNALRKTHLDC